MAYDILFGHPERTLCENMTPKAGEAIVAGMFVTRDANNLAVKAAGSAGDYAMFSLTDQPTYMTENGGKIAVVKENGSFWTNQYITGAGYTPGCELIVSTGSHGKITKQSGTLPIVGRFRGIQTINGVSMLGFDLVRN